MESTAKLRIGVLLILIVVGLVSSLGTAWRTGDWEGLFLNLGTEMLGAVATYVLLELFIGGRERREAKKADLVEQMGSNVKDVAIAAAEELGRRGWLYDGSLQGTNLERANLEGAWLHAANLEGTTLIAANLKRAWLYWANLQRTGLFGTYLEEANLHRANLQEADLAEANLQEADLTGANLEGAFLYAANLEGAFLCAANLKGANLKGANLEGTDFNEYTALPDGTNWTPGTDMARFTDPDHPDFWSPDAE